MRRIIRSRGWVWAPAAVLVLTGCSSDSPEPVPPDPTVLPVTGLRVDDVTNQGDGSDLEVVFSAPTSLDIIKEFRVAVAKAAKASSYSAADLIDAGDDQVSVVAASAGEVRVTLASSTQDLDGDAVAEGVPYRILVASIGTDPAASLLASPSDEITTIQSTLKITYLGNAGVVLSDGEVQVAIDALHAATSPWLRPPVSEVRAFESADAPYDHEAFVLVTHAHGDHYSPGSISRFLGARSDAKVVGPPLVVQSFDAARVVTAAPARRERVEIDLDGVSVSVIHLRHFDQFGNNFAAVVNYAYLVTLGGFKMLHVGDVDFTDANFEGLGLADEDIDIVFVPMFNTLIGETTKNVIQTHIAPREVVALHLLESRLGTEPAAVRELFPEATIITTGFTVLRR